MLIPYFFPDRVLALYALLVGVPVAYVIHVVVLVPYLLPAGISAFTPRPVFNSLLAVLDDFLAEVASPYVFFVGVHLLAYLFLLLSTLFSVFASFFPVPPLSNKTSTSILGGVSFGIERFSQNVFEQN